MSETMDETVESLKAALAVEKAAREKAEAERDEARKVALYTNVLDALEKIDASESALAAAQKRIGALEGALRQLPWGRDALASVNAALASPSESAPQQCMQSKGEPEFWCKHDGSGHSIYCPLYVVTAPQPTPETRVDVEDGERARSMARLTLELAEHFERARQELDSVESVLSSLKSVGDAALARRAAPTKEIKEGE